MLIRIFVVIMLVLFGLRGIYNTEGLSNTLFLNTLFLFSIPFLLEYFKGMDTYSGYTSAFRWAGFILNGIIISICVTGYFGEITLYYDERTNFLNKFSLFGVINIDLLVIKIITGIAIFLSICDFIFTFNKRELYFLNAMDEVNAFIQDKFNEYASESTPDSRKEHFKKQILAQVSTNAKVEGGMG